MSDENKCSGSGGGPGCLGCIVAVLLSIKTWGVTWWVVPHFCFGWGYVAYWVIFLSGWFPR